MRVQLPKNLGKLADLCPKETGRYSAFAGVRLTTSEGEYQAEVTDGRFLVRVKGDCPNPDTDFVNPAIDAAPNGATASVVPAKAWKDAFKSVAAHNTLSVVQSPEVTTLASAEGLFQPRNVEGVWPNTDMVFPKAEPRIKLTVDAKQLAKLLSLVASFNADDEDHRVTIEIIDARRPLTLKAGQCVALVVPLNPN